MNLTIEEDNLEKLLRFKTSPPHPSYIAGFIDGDGCIFVRKIADGFQSGFTITQCRTNILQILRYHFGGSITSSINRNNKIENLMDETNEYFHKHNVRNQYNLLIRSNEYQILLEYLQNSFIIKEKQYKYLQEFNKFIHLPNKTCEKEKLHDLCSKYNKKCKLDENNLSRLNIEYISGLFDAEGCVFIGNNKRIKITIAQKNHPEILNYIQQFLHYGKIEGNIKFVVRKKSNCLNFIQLVKPFIIVKYNQILALETFLTTTDISIKEQMYKICNEEKHKIENFTDLNQSEKGKNAFLEIVKVRELKKKLCGQIKMQQFYKEKSEKMTGDGNHNFAKTFTEQHKKKMSLSIRDSKNGVYDEIIKNVREMIQSGHKNIDIQNLLNLPRHTITRIKNGILVCRNEDKSVRTSLTQTEVNISKRKIQPEEIILVIEKYIDGWTPIKILDYLIGERNKLKILNTITIDIVKNIKRSIKNNKRLLYENEITAEEYNNFVILVNKCKELI